MIGRSYLVSCKVLALALATGGAFGGLLPTASAQQSQTNSANGSVNVPAVSEQQAYHLFECLLYDRVIKNYDTRANLRSRYQGAQSDQDRALIMSASAVGIADQISNAAYEATRYAALEREGWQLNDTIYRNALSKYANASLTYDGHKMTFDGEVASLATTLLDYAHEKHMNFTDYMNKVFIPHKTTDNTSLAIKDAAAALGH